MIVITGATGRLGRGVVDRLRAEIPADRIAVSVRDPERAADLAALGVSVRRGDFADPETLDAAFAGATQVLVVSTDTLGAEGVARATVAIDRAYAAGAERVLYTSHQAASPDSLFVPGRDHAAVEAHLASLGRPYTALRNGYYLTSLQFQIGDAPRSGEIVAPADGPVAWADRADLADAAAAVLLDEGRFDGPTPPLTGPRAVELADVAAALSAQLGRTVRRVVLDDEEFVERRVADGTPEPFARALLGSFQAARRGEFAAVDPTLQRLIGREPTTVAEFLSTVAGG